MVGIIKPTKGSGSLVELIKMLPDGIGIIPLFNNVRHGKIEEFQASIPLNPPEKFSFLFPPLPN
jgi:hypothetical protein